VWRSGIRFVGVSLRVVFFLALVDNLVVVGVELLLQGCHDVARFPTFERHILRNIFVLLLDLLFAPRQLALVLIFSNFLLA